MTGFDQVVCEYPLSDPRDQDREFLTRDFGGWGRDRYVITRDGRLIRQAPVRREDRDLVKDVEWPIDGDIRMVDDEVPKGEPPVEYAVRFISGVSSGFDACDWSQARARLQHQRRPRTAR